VRDGWRKLEGVQEEMGRKRGKRTCRFGDGARRAGATASCSGACPGCRPRRLICAAVAPARRAHTKKWMCVVSFFLFVNQ
jgi:hypothetical protein